MTATGQDIILYRGDTRTLSITVRDKNLVPVNITGAQISWVMYKFTPGNIVLTKNNASGVFLTNPAVGIFEIRLLPANTKPLAIGKYLHECELIDVAGNSSTIFTGKFDLLDSKTT